MKLIKIIDELIDIYINVSSYYLITLWRKLYNYNDFIELYISNDLYIKWINGLFNLQYEWIYGNGKNSENIKIDCTIILKNIIDDIIKFV